MNKWISFLLLIIPLFASITIAVTGQGEEVPLLNNQEKRILLTLARTTVERVVKGDEPPVLPEGPSILKENRGAFVTLHEKGELRGCIGMLEGRAPLDETVREMAVEAALRDWRFTPVTPNELKDLDIEISVLSPLRMIKDINEIQVGEHGIWITKGSYRGVLLPQVATEQGYDRMMFLQQTCRKAGLPPDAWKDSTTVIEIFSAEVFGEKDLPKTENK